MTEPHLAGKIGGWGRDALCPFWWFHLLDTHNWDRAADQKLKLNLLCSGAGDDAFSLWLISVWHRLRYCCLEFVIAKKTNKLAYCFFGNLFFCNLERDIKALGFFFPKTTKEILYLFNQSFVSFPFVQDMVHLKNPKIQQACVIICPLSYFSLFSHSLLIYQLSIIGKLATDLPTFAHQRGAPGLFPALFSLPSWLTSHLPGFMLPPTGKGHHTPSDLQLILAPCARLLKRAWDA